MNYASKFDGKLFIDGAGTHANAHAPGDSVSPHTTHAPADAIIVPDAHLLFNGDFKRSGVDLILSADDQKLVLHDYFKGEKRAALASPDGAHLTGDIVKALAGHVEYAQAADGSASVNKVIGHVTKLAGTATAIRNGVSIILNQGDNVEKGDVVQSGSGSTLGITFIDGTVFGLSSNARMVLNEMVYDPNGSNNSSLLSLVAGTITFVAGETAKHGDMKIDTPVATMGIRGTAVLVEIDFDTAGQNGLPDTKFQVLVEPDGTTGSYILFDKVTLTPFAIVDKAGTQFSFSNGNFSQSLTGLTPEVQKLITDVFAQRFSDNTNTKTFDHHTDFGIPDSLAPIKVGNTTITQFVVQVNTLPTTSTPTSNGPTSQIQHIDGPPSGVILNANGQASTDFKITEIPGVTGSTTSDAVSGKVNFVDINAGDQPTVSAKFDGSTYTDPHGHVLSLNSQQLADIKAVEVDLAVTATPGNNNNGSAGWSYTVPDGSFDFLAAGETLQLTYTLTVDNNYAPNDEKTDLKFTITITGTNDVPVITTAAQTINFSGGKGTVGGDLAPTSETPGVHLTHPPGTLTYKESGTLTFTDPDLTDTHTLVSTGLTGDLTGASLSGTALDLAALEAKYPGPFQTFENALAASIGADSTGTGTGTINWTFAELPTYVADFIPSGETLTLTYTVEVKDSQGAISTQTITVTIAGNDTPAVVWIDTKAAPPSGALWSDGSNWETGNAPTISDDTIIITDQLRPNFPTYPVVIDSTASAKTLVMNDLTGKAPELDNNSALTIAGGLTLNADAILKNFGDVSVGTLATLLSISGLAEILDHSVLQNSGTIELAHGGDFLDQSSITNSGTIEVVSDTLDVQVNIANSASSSGTLQVDNGATLKLSTVTAASTTITNGNLTLGSGSTLDIESIVGATLDGVTVTGTNASTGPTVAASTIEIGAAGASILKLDDGTTIKNGILTIAGGSTLDIESSTGATLDGVTVNGSGAIQVDGLASPQATLFLDDGTSITDVTLTVGSVGTLEITTAQGATLDHVGVTNHNSIEVASGSILTLQGATSVTNDVGATVTVAGELTLNGATIDGGTIDDTGTLSVSAASAIDNATVDGGGNLTVTSGATLTLDTVTLDSVTLAGSFSNASTLTIDHTVTLNGATIDGGIIDDTGTLSVSAASEIDNATVDGGGHITVATGETLTLDTVTLDSVTLAGNFGNASTLTIDNTVTLNGATIDGGIIDDTGTLSVSAASEIEHATVDGGGNLTVTSGATLTLDTVTLDSVTLAGSFSNASTLTIDHTVTLNGATINGGTIDDTGTLSVSAASEIEHATVDGGGNLTVTSGATLTLDTVTLDSVTLAGSFSNASTLTIDHTVTLNGATINGGTIDDTGTLSVSAASEIEHATVDGGGNLTVTSGATLTLDTVTLDSVTLAGSFSNASTLTIDNTVTLNGATIDGGIIDDTGTLSVSAASEIEHATVDGGGNLTVSSGATLTLDTVTLDSVTLAGSFSNASTLTIDHTVTLNGATIDGGIIDDTGTLSVSTASEIEHATVDGGGDITVTSGATLTLDSVTLDSVTLAGSFSNASTLTIDNTVTLNGATIDGGIIDDTGTLSVSTASEIEHATVDGGGHITVSSGATLTLDTVTLDSVTLAGSFSNASTLTLDNTVTLNGATIDGGIIDDTGTLSVSAASEIEHATVDGGGNLTVTSGATLTLDTVTLDSVTLAGSFSNASTLTIDNTVTLNGATIDGGIIDDTGTLSVSTASEIEHATVDGGGHITVSSGATLTLDTVTLDSVTLAGSFSNASTLTIDNTVTLNGATIDGGIIDDTGTLSVSTASEIEHATVDGGGHITVSSGATLTLDTVTLDSVTLAGNFGNSSTLTIDNTVTLNGATIDGGTIDDTGTLSVSAASAIEHATVDGGGNLTVTSGATLTLDTVTLDSVTLAGSFSNASTLTIDNTVTLNGATIDGGIIDDTGTLSVSAASAIEHATVDGGGNLTVTSGATLTLDTVTLDSVTLAGSFSNASTLTIDNTVTLNGATIDGGIIDDTGTLSVSTASEIEHATVDGGGHITVTSGATLTLDTVTLDSVTLAGSFDNSSTLTIDNTVTLNGATIDGGTIDDTGTLSVSAASEIEHATVDGGGNLTVASGATLTLDAVTLDSVTLAGSFSNASTLTIDNTVTLNGATIDGGIIDDTGTLSVSTASEIEHATVDGGGHITVSSGATLTLDTVTLDSVTLAGSFSNASTLTLDNTVTLNGATIDGGIIDDTGTLSVSAASEIEHATVDGGGNLTVTSGATLTLDTVTLDSVTLAGSFSNASTLTIDNTVTLNGATIDGGTIDDTGTLSVSAASEIEHATVDGGGNLTVTSGATLTLDTVILDSVTLAGSFSNASTLTIDNTVTLNGATINGGTIDDTGTLSVSAASAIDNATVDGGGNLTVSSGATLTLDTVTLDSVTLAGSFSNASTLTLDNTVTLNGATIDGGTVNIVGELDSTGTSFITGSTIINSSHIDVVSGTLTIDPTPVTNSGTIEVQVGGTLVLSGETITNSVATDDGTTDGIIKVDANESAHATLDLENSAIGGGTVTISGEMDSTGTSAINGADVTNTGTIDVATGALTFDAASTLHNSGTTKVDSGATLTIHGSVDNSGTLETNGGTLVIGADAVVTGTSPDVTIHGGTADLVGTGAPLALNVTFSGAGTLELDDSQHYSGTITGYGAGDKIDLTDLGYSSSETDVWNSANNTLTIYNGTQTATLNLAGTFGQNDFAITSDANGKTELVSNSGGLTQPQVTVAGLDSAGNAVAGNGVTADFSSPGNGNPGAVTYTWLENGHVVQSGTSDIFTPGVADAGNVIDVVVGFGSEQITAVAGTVAAPPAVSFNLAESVTTNFNTPLTLDSLNLSFADAGSDSFTVILDASHGALSLANAGTVIEGGVDTGALTLTGTLAAIDTALGDGLVYTPTTGYAGSDTISVSAQDGAFGSNTATLDINVIGDPVIAPASAQTIGVNEPTKISGISLSETGNIAGETFTVTVSDTHGQLSATAVGDGDTVTITSGTLVTITGSLSDVNTDLATLTDTNATPGSDPITLTATDSFGNTATSQTTAVTVNDVPVMTPASAQTIGVNETTAISGISLSETGNITGETFTVTVSDTHGQLSATAVGDGDTVTITSGTLVTITGSLADVNTDLATLTDTNATPGSDPITLTATDSFGNTATSQTTAVTVNDVPVITPASAQTIGVNETTAISGISLTETGNTTGEIFTVTVSDTHGQLSATAVGGHGDTVTIASGTLVTITGSLSDVNADLATLTDTNGTPGSDPITLTAIDSFGNSATSQTTAVTVSPPAVGNAPVVEINGVTDTSITIAPDGLSHAILAGLTITDADTTAIDNATVTWNISSATITGVFGPGISISAQGLGEFDYTGISDDTTYASVLSLFTVQTWTPDAGKFIVTVNDGLADSAPATVTINIEIPTTWDVWTGGGGDGDWKDTANWSLGHAPGSAEVAYVDAASHPPAIITDDLAGSNQSVTQLHVLSGTTLDISDDSGAVPTFEVLGLTSADGQSSAGLMNAGLIDVQDAAFGISGETSNFGTIEIDSSGTLIVESNVTLEGGGTVSLVGGSLVAPPAGTVGDPLIENVNDTIGGTGTIGADDGQLTLHNDSGGTIDAIGGTLTLDLGNTITNAGLLEATNGGTLAIVDGTTIAGGTLTIDGTSTLDVEVGNSGQGGANGSSFDAALDGVTVTNHGSIEIDQQDSGATLVLDDGTTISGSTLTVDNSGLLEIEVGPAGQGGAAGAGHPDATLDGVTVTNNNAIDIVDASGSILRLDDGTTVSGGTLTIDGANTLDVEAGPTNGNGATLDDVQVVNLGTIQIDGAILPSATLTLDDGTSVSGSGTLIVGSVGTLVLNDATITGINITDNHLIDVTGSSTIQSANPDSNAVISGGGVLTIENGQTLTLDHVTVSGTVITFAGTGDTLIADQATSLGTIAGMTVGDAIDLGGIVGDHYSFDGSTLEIFDAANTVLKSLSLSGVGADSQFGLASDDTGGTIITDLTPTVTITDRTTAGLDFHAHNALASMGAGAVQLGGSLTSFTIVDTANGDNLRFVVDGSNLTYGTDDNGGITVAGTITSFHEFTNDSTPVPLADFTGLSVNAATWMSDVQLAASGNRTALDDLTSTFAYNFVGGSGPDTFGSAGHADTLSGTGADVFDGGGAPAGFHDTETGGAGSTFVFAQGYGALTITNFDQDSNGNFSQSIGDHIELNGFSGHPTVTYVNGNTIADFGNGDVLTLLHVDPANLVDSDFIGGGNGNNGGGNGNNSGGPAVSNAGNIVTYTGTPVILDPSIAVSDATGTVSSVNAWISAGAQTGDALTIHGTVDGDLTNPDGTIHYHFDGNAISLTETSGSPTLANFDAALQQIQFTPGAADGARTITWAAQDNTSATSPTVTTTVDVGPTLNSFTLTISEGGTTVLSDANFDVTHAHSTDFFSLQAGSVKGGEFEVTQDGGITWPSAPTGGFTIAQIEAGDVRFVQDGSDTTPTFSITVSNATDVSPAIAPTVTFTIADASFTGGTISTEADGLLILDNAVITDATFQNGGTIEITGDSTISGGTIHGPLAPTYTWIDGTSGDWGTAANWSGGVVPNGFDNARIGGTSTETVTVSTTESVNLLTFSDAHATLDVTNLATLSVYGGFAVTAAQAIDIASGVLNVGGSAATLDNTTLDLGAPGSVPPSPPGFPPLPPTPTFPTLGSLNVEFGTVLTLGPNLTVDAVDGQIFGPGSLDNEGTIATVGSGGSLSIQMLGGSFTNEGTISFAAQGGTGGIFANGFDNEGTIAVSNGDWVSFGTFGTSVFGFNTGFGINNGTIAVDGHLTINGELSGSGQVDIDNGGTLEVSGNISGITFAAGGTGTLQIDPFTVITGPLSGLAVGDVIDFTDATIASATVDGNNLLTVTLAGGQTETIALAGPLPQGTSFQIEIDGHGGQELVVANGPSAPTPTYTWADGTSADWGMATDWSGGIVPNGLSNATIGGTGAETVTVSGSESVNTLTLNDANATLQINGILSVYGGFAVTAAQAIDVASGTLNIGGSAVTLDNTTLDLGAIVSAPPGFPGAPTFPTLGTLTIEPGTALTLGPNLTIDVVDGQIFDSGSLDNKGTITTVGSGGQLSIQMFGGSFTNENTGTITFAAQGGNGSIDTSLGFDNEGIIAVSNGDMVSLSVEQFNNDGSVSPGINNGTISVGSGGHLTIFGNLSGSGHVDIDNGGTLEIPLGGNSDVNFNGGTGVLEIDHGTVFTGTLSGLALGDAIDFTNSTITSATIDVNNLLTVTLGNGFTEHITLAGPLPQGTSLQIEIDGHGGNELVVANGPIAPTPTYTWVDGTSADWSTATDWSGGIVPNSFSNATIGGVGTETVTVFGVETVNALTLSDAHATLQINGMLTVDGGFAVSAAQAIDVASGSLTATSGATTIDNTTIDLGTSGSVVPESSPPVMLPPTLGTLNIEFGTTLTLGANLIVDVIDGQITDFGVDAGFLDNKGEITTVGNGGQLSIQMFGGFTNESTGTVTFAAQGGTGLISAGEFDNEGTIAVSNGDTVNFDVYTVNINDDTVSPGINNGTISVGSGGHLTISGGLDGGGHIDIDNGGTLEISGTLSNAVSFAAGGVGTLQIDSGTALTGTLSGLVLGDAIDFANATIANEAVNGNTLTVTLAGGLIETITLAGPLPQGTSFDVELDGHGGNELVVINGTSNNGSGIGTGAIEVDSGQTLTLDNGATVVNGKLTIDLSGTLVMNNATITETVITNNHLIDITGSSTIDGGASLTGGNVTIESGQTLTLDHVAVSGATITFATGSGTLDLTQPSTFTGEIAGISGTGDVLDLHGFNASTTTASTGDGSFNRTTDTTTLTVTDSSDNLTETFTLAGNLSSSTWTVTDDQHGGANIVDPPATSNGPHMAVVPPSVATSTISPSAPNQTLTGNAVSDTFVFNFANVGQATVTNFHAATDTLQFNSQLFANVQAALNATQDDGHGNTVITLDAHDAITLSGVVKAQLHASDFHFA